MADLTQLGDYFMAQIGTTTSGNEELRLVKKIGATDTSMTVNFEPVDETGAAITEDFFITMTNSNGATEVMRCTNVSTTTLTVARGMARGGIDFAGAAGNAVFHNAGDVIKCCIYAGLVQMLTDALAGDIGSGKKLNAAPTYMGVGIHRDRVFADATARDAAITSPTNGDKCYNTATGTFQKYQAGAWANDATGTTVNATATVAGKGELATTAESIAATDTGGTGASNWVLPSDIAANDQSGTFVYAADAEASDTYVIALTPTLTALTAGQTITFKANTANTGACTLNIDTLGAKTIKKFHDQDLEDGDIESGSLIEVKYDGTNFQMQTPVATNMTSAQADTLTDGSNADALHVHAASRLENTEITPVTIANTTTETNLLQFSLAGGSLSTTNIIRIKMYVSDMDFNSTDICTVRMKYGTTTITTVSLAATGTGTNFIGFLDFDLIGNGDTSVQSGNCFGTVGKTALTVDGVHVYDNGTAAEDSTGALNVTITAEWSNAVAGNSITVDRSFSELLK